MTEEIVKRLRFNIKTDGAPSLSDWMAERISSAALWELVLAIRSLLRFIYCNNLN